MSLIELMQIRKAHLNVDGLFHDLKAIHFI